MGRAGTHNRPAAAVVRCRLRHRRRSLLHGGARAGDVGGSRTDRGVCTLRIAAAPADRAARDRAWPLRHRFGLCNCDAQDRADRPSGAAFSSVRRTVAGFVELREESQHTDRFVLRVDRIDGGRIEELPSASGFRSSAAQRLQSALSLKSKPRSSRRCSRSNPAENEQMIRRNINKLAITGPK